MARRLVVYGLDIETDTSSGGLDPRVAPVVTVALALPRHDEIFQGRETTLLCDLDERLRTLPPGILATWNGAAFDLPFLAHRGAHHGLDLGLRLSLDPQRRQRALTYRAAWHHHSHLDTLRLYYDEEPAPRVSSSLRSIARRVGLGSGSGRRHPPHDLSHEARHACASSDARLARVLTERRMPGAARLVDRLDPTAVVAATA